MEAVDVRGRFVWHELMTRDVAGAKKFYSKLTGWKPQPWPLDPSYTVCHSGAGPTAGIFAIPADMPAEMPAHWVSYVGTRDVDGTVAAAVRAGASVVKGPDDIKGAGRYAVLKDPQGAVFAILDPENARTEAGGVPPLGTFSWHELATTDNEAAFAFYSSLFGWDAIDRHDMGPAGVYIVFGSNGIQRGGIWNKPAEMPGPPNWLPYVHVPSADDGSKSAESAGGKTLVPPMEVPGGSRITTFMDPTGAPFAIQSMPATAATAQSAKEPAASSKTAKPKPKAKAKAVAKPKAKAKAKTKVKAKAKAKAKAKTRAKPPMKKKSAKRAAPKKAKKNVARKAAKKKSKPARRKK
jgi:predicted enzyme related to lactoylglutathione lyase